MRRPPTGGLCRASSHSSRHLFRLSFGRSPLPSGINPHNHTRPRRAAAGRYRNKHDAPQTPLPRDRQGLPQNPQNRGSRFALNKMSLAPWSSTNGHDRVMNQGVTVRVEVHDMVGPIDRYETAHATNHGFDGSQVVLRPLCNGPWFVNLPNRHATFVSRFADNESAKTGPRP